jgi:serine/threonine-protein kinase
MPFPSIVRRSFRPLRARCPSEDTLVRFLEGPREPRRQRRLDAHLDECADCRQVLAGVAPALPTTSTESRASLACSITAEGLEDDGTGAARAPLVLGPEAVEEERRRLSSRLLVWFRAVGLIGLGLLVLVFALVAVFGDSRQLVAEGFNPVRWLHAGVVLAAAAGYGATAVGLRSLERLRRIDAYGTLAIVSCASLSTALQATEPAFGVAKGALTTSMSVGFLLIMRAATVPSSGRRTLAITGSAAAVAILSMTAAALKTDSGPGATTAVGVLMVFWLGFACAVATTVSRVVFGLRSQLQKARAVGQYTLQQEIGRGGMGVVYRAKHALLRRDTAVKILPSAQAGPELRARFEREVRLTADLHHPNTVAIFDYGASQEGLLYYAMEYVDGLDLEELTARYGPQPPGRVAQLLTQILASLSEAHERGLVHRDVKPANVMVTDRGAGPDTVKVLDFGLARRVAEHARESFAGTPHYLAPEAIDAPWATSPAADLYAVAAVGYYLLTGAPVFEGRNANEVCQAHLHRPAQPPSVRSGRAIPERLERLILWGLDKDPSGRPTSAKSYREAFAALELGWTEQDAQHFWAAYRSGALVDAPSTSGGVATAAGRSYDDSDDRGRWAALEAGGLS